MGNPQVHVRAYLDDGPRAGETVSIVPTIDGAAPRTIVLDANGTVQAIGGTPEHPNEVEHATTIYTLIEPDMDNALWVYRTGPGPAAERSAG